MFYYQIEFPDSKPSVALTELIEKKLRKMQQFHPRIVSAHVSVRIPHRHSGTRSFHVRIQLDLPGKTLMVNREPDVRDDHADPNIAVRDAFLKLARQLEDYVRSRKDYSATAIHAP